SPHHVKYDSIPYPQAGDENPTVRIGTLNVKNGDSQWMNVKLDEGYIPRIYWTAEEGQLAVVHLHRLQDHLKLYFCDATTGDNRLVMKAKSKYSIDIFDFFADVSDFFYFPENHDEFFWISDRNGWSHIYRYNYDGKLLNQVTRGPWEVSKVQAIDYDAKRLYYSSTENSPLQRQLYAIDFDGTNKTQITQ